MKKTLIVTLIVLVILILVVLAIFIVIKKNEYNENMPYVEMIIEKGTLTKTSAEVIIKGKEHNISCGESYYIEIKEDGVWKRATTIKSPTFNLLAQLADKDGKLTEKIDWSKSYGELKNGEYRIVKSVSTPEGEKTVYAEFTIE